MRSFARAPFPGNEIVLVRQLMRKQNATRSRPIGLRAALYEHNDRPKNVFRRIQISAVNAKHAVAEADDHCPVVRQLTLISVVQTQRHQTQLEFPFVTRRRFQLE